MRLPIPPCPRRNILDFPQLSSGLGPFVPAFSNPTGHVVGSIGLHPSGRPVPRCRSPRPVRVDEPALASHGQAGASGDLWHGLLLFPGNDPVCPLPQLPAERTGRRLNWTRGKVLLIGLAVLLLGGLGQVGFQAAGFEGVSAGIAAEALLVVIVVVWTSSYLFRVVTGQMTYMDQRRRYREVYDKQEAEALQARFDALPEEEQQALLRKIGADGLGPTDGEAPVDS